ncbi:hypothetical protein [Methylotenera sp.]|uniref:hypothetical protein n=1 Tax=Methylotenera sp. TaxID=2051956 RepID=UPI0024871B47|nr:hypothetical protein [Methylotenera sp.]MDI1298610.1 hypothetical protein [Methylotenera sp.]
MSVIKRSLAGVIRERLADIEHQIKIGVSQKTIAQNMKIEGYEITYQYFRELVSRARNYEKKHKVQQAIIQQFTPVEEKKEEATKPKSFVFDSKPDPNKLF